jgi:hypothetical protein
MPPRESSRALGLQRQDPGEEVQAGGVDTPVSAMNGTKFAWSRYVFVILPS